MTSRLPIATNQTPCKILAAAAKSRYPAVLGSLIVMVVDVCTRVVRLCVCVSPSVSVSLSVCLPACLSVCLAVWLSCCLYMCLCLLLWDFVRVRIRTRDGVRVLLHSACV